MAENEPKRLTRSSKDKKIAGVCGGIANYLNVDPTAVRAATLLAIIFAGLSIWAYIILWICMPEEECR